MTRNGKKILEDVSMGGTWTTYMGSVEGVLRKLGWWGDETWRLMGSTGMAFHFIVHEKLCPSSVTVYEWEWEHQLMLDRIGVYAEHQSIMQGDRLEANTFDLARSAALERIRRSIDRGVPVIIWAPTPILEFGLVKGYDDGDGVLHVVDCANPSPDPLLYENVGRSEVPILYIQTILDKVDVDPESAHRSALRFGLAQWEKERHVDPRYGSGRKGYANLIAALERGEYDDFGLGYILAVYADAKKCLARYLPWVAETLPALSSVAKAGELFAVISEKYEAMTGICPFKGPARGAAEADHVRLAELVKLAKECFPLEERAMGVIGRALE